MVSCGSIISDSTPSRRKCKMPLVLRTLHGYTVPPREQPALASLTSELADSASFGYLRRRKATTQEGRISPSPPKKRKYGAPQRVACGIIISDSTPSRRKCKMPLVLRTLLAFSEPPREQPALASLTSKLVDSASFGYLRLRRNVRISTSIKKAATLLGSCFFWRRRRDSDSRAGKTRPTPLAGAPLRPLEYFSKKTKLLRRNPSFGRLP